MSHFQKIRASDGHVLSVYQSADQGRASIGAAVVILQEIFGVNAHIQSVADSFAKRGYLAIAPALFDRLQPEISLDYTPEGREIGRGLAVRLTVEGVLQDIAATLDYARSQVEKRKVGIVGYCLGGSYAWLSATRLHPDAAVGYYGSKVVQHAEEKPQAPVILHFGRQDKGIPLEGVELFKQQQPTVPVYLYDAGHGFNRLGSESYEESSAHLAFERTLGFLAKNLL